MKPIKPCPHTPRNPERLGLAICKGKRYEWLLGMTYCEHKEFNTKHYESYYETYKESAPDILQP
jgi:hypothetical protein